MTAEVIGRNPESKPLGTLGEIRTSLHQRQGAFFAKFKEYGLRARHHIGWEVIETEPSGFITKKHKLHDVAGYTDPSRTISTFYIKDDALFTGKNWCDVFSIAIYTALSSRTSDNIEISFGGLGTDMNRENWLDSRYTPEAHSGNHRLVRATDKTTGEVMYIDGSYGQIDHRLRETIVTVSEAEFPQYYRNGNEVPAFVASSRDIIDYYSKHPIPLTQAELNDLIASLTPMTAN